MERTVEPGSVGLDPRQLATLDRHFAEYVDDGRLAGWQLVVSRKGEVAHASTYGLADLETETPVGGDTLWRVYSMTKPITTVAAMMLWEEGAFELTDPISRWLPEFERTQVFDKGSITVPFTVPALEPIRVWHLMTHTSGLTYGFLMSSTVDAIYRARGETLEAMGARSLEESCGRWAAMPLLFQPGTKWGYSVATDVLGRLVEVISGKSLADFMAERIFEPLGMTDARWWVDDAEAGRLAGLYARDPRTGRATRFDAMAGLARERPAMFAGGGGLICSAADYQRFMLMLLGGGEVDGVRLLGSRTVRFMTRNHLPGGADLATVSSGGFAETIFDGIGFGLGFAVVLDPTPGRTPITAGSYYWGGLASTAFWIDPAEELTVSFFTQLIPSSQYPIRPQLRQLVYAALR
ncbi:MAG TPA: serine hydrolase domain-containing protein [Micromonosporaceae bacterium]|jgi:CubicO group peptidase (beta-lactamase class C family)|nr:serine hydrolase domain-containing protein [Micromonosporaceae bacterium]